MAGTAGTVAFEALGRASGCYNNPGEAPGFEKPKADYEGCKKAGEGFLMWNWYYADGTLDERTTTQMKELIAVNVRPPDGLSWTHQLIWINTNGQQVSSELRAQGWTFEQPYGRTYLGEGATCEIPGPDPQFPDWQPDTPIAPPYEYTDPETGCTWQIQAFDSYLNSAGEPVFHWKATSNDPVQCGGPYEWWGNGQEPNIPAFEDPRGPDARPTPPTLPPGPGQDIKDDLDKIKEELEKLKECACPEKPVQEGDYRTISFRSDETSPFGKSRLRKRFKYRSQSGLDLGAVVDHWADFEFAAGPVAVGHVGSALGSPQVWAATADEGKRVIRHAGGEAGIDPDQVGEWRIGSRDNARYGVSGQMRVDTTGGYYWITARDGSDGPPIVVRT